MTTITNLTCEYRTNPLGIDVTVPRLSWQMESHQRGARQVAYRLRAASDPQRLQGDDADVWDSGRVESDQSVHVPYDGPRLHSRQRVYWDVEVWDETGAVSRSTPAWFEMGLLRRGDWRARWIGAQLSGGPRTTIPAPYLRKPFSLPSQVRTARLYVTALGLVECAINGQRVGDDVFVPGWTDYRQRVQYMVYDVTPLLSQGTNVLGAILGDGWAVGHIGWEHRQQYYDRPRLLAQLEATLVDGRTIRIVSDRTWVHRFGPLLENDLLMGEAYDARLEMPGWDAPGYDDRRWLPVEVFDDPGIELSATNGPTVRRMEEIAPVSNPTERGTAQARRAIVDLGQNMVGRIRLTGYAPAGTTVTLRYAEVLDADGSLYTANLRTARATDHYTFRGEGEESWEPRFTFHGFRYVELSGYPGPLTRDTITGIVLHSDMSRTGEFTCSEPLLEQLQHNILWGQKGNFVDVPTDCPQRDERLGWTGDIQVFVPTAAYNMSVAGFMTRWLRDLADAQKPNGSVPAVVPQVSAIMDDGGPAWADAAIICPWNLYLCYGDRRILESNYAVMSRFMQFIQQASPGNIRCAPEYDGWPGFGDWLSINASTPRDLIGTAYLAYDASLMAQIALVLGKGRDAGRYRRLHSQVKKAFAARFLVGSSQTSAASRPSAVRQAADEADAISRGNLQAVDYGPIESKVFNNALFTPTQTAYVLALHWDLLPGKLRPLAMTELVADIERRGIHLSTGFVGAPYLPHVLGSNGRLDIAYALLNQKTWPSWLYAVTQGATTIWERWDGWTADNGFQDAGMNSFNHYAYGSIGAWMYNNVAGIELDPLQPGYKHAILRPRPGGGLTHALGRLQTPYGELLSQWNLETGVFRWTVVVPPNTTATAYLPVPPTRVITLDGRLVRGTAHDLAAGEHRFTAE